MSFTFDCLNPLRDFSNITNRSTKILHPNFPSDQTDLISKLATFLIDLSFSSVDLQVTLKTSRIRSSKFLRSLIIYTSIVLFIWLLSVIIFYVISTKTTQTWKRSLWKTIRLIFFYILSIFVVIQMIFLLRNVHQSKLDLNRSIDETHTQFNSKILSENLLKQVQQFSSKSTSTLIDGSKSFLVKAFVDHYQIGELSVLANNIAEQLQSFKSLISNSDILRKIVEQFRNSYDDLLNLQGKLCDLINGNRSMEIEKKFFDVINLIERQLNFLTNILNEDLFKKVNSKLFNSNRKDQIHSIITLITTLTLTSISLMTIIPFLFILLLTGIHLYSRWNQQMTSHRSMNSHPGRLHSLDVHQLQSIHSHQRDLTHSSRHHHRRRRSSKKSHRRKVPHLTRDERSYSMTMNDLVPKKYCTARRFRFFLYSIRIGFAVVGLLSIVLLLISAVFYGLDMVLHSSCQLVHHNQPLLISVITENFVKSVDELDVNRTVIRLIDDCRNGNHFSEYFFEKYSSQFNEQFLPIVIQFNEKIVHRIQQSSQIDKISSGLHLLHQLTQLLPSTNVESRLNLIRNDLQQIENLFRRVNESNGQLPKDFVQKTFAKFRLFFQKIIQSSLDSCPFPLNEILKMDHLICHETASRIHGLWIKIVFFVFFILFALCIFGVRIFEQIY